MNAYSHRNITNQKRPLFSSSDLLSHRFTVKSLPSLNSVHAHLTKLGLDLHTIIGNRLISLYSHFGAITAVLQVFRNLPYKNTFTWNITIAAFSRIGQMGMAHQLFEEMPQRDVVSWNSMISGCVSVGSLDKARALLSRMWWCGMRPSAFTFSIAAICVSSARQVKQVHGAAVRSGLVSSNVVLGNSLVDKYGKVGLLKYAMKVFHALEEPDMVSWNSVISASGRDEAFRYFRLMREAMILPDEFTMSNVISVCADLLEVQKGEQVFALCFKLDCGSNSIVIGAVIDMYSQCGKLDKSIKLFDEISTWDTAVCDSMISAYATNGFTKEAQKLFVSILHRGFAPSEFTFSSILITPRSDFPSMECCGPQIQSMILKLGFSSEIIVASSLMDMYAKLGSIESALKIFNDTIFKDLTTWNTMITALARNGNAREAFRLFDELQEKGIEPDRITLKGILSACSLEGLIDEGLHIFTSMQEKYNVKPNREHYMIMVNMMAQAGRFEEAMEIILTMPGNSNASVWGVILEACQIHGTVKLAENVAEKMIESKPNSPLSYTVLAQMYSRTCRWDSLARIKRAMLERGMAKMMSCSWIGVKNRTFVFQTDELLHHGGGNLYSMLSLLAWDKLQSGWIGVRNRIFAFQTDELLHHGGENLYSMLNLLAWDKLQLEWG
ncbi:putative Pentatricopeptide repeat-containing protein [Zostera marina]|uniref:Putative Pentatricopeptide repeat-containing protein n=1 Tax=Zostera marina TaxID=29655 RepID=A0A0K9P798_ZOSMR|nr:putative Pentatricopeptide repeat-containing protein [Zostera marina]